MNILSDLNTALSELGIPIETGVFSGAAPDEYLVITPLSELFEFADNAPYGEIQQVRLSLFSKGNYITVKNNIVRRLLDADFTVSERRYIGREDDTGYHHFAIDVEKDYTTQEDYTLWQQ